MTAQQIGFLRALGGGTAIGRAWVHRGVRFVLRDVRRMPSLRASLAPSARGRSPPVRPLRAIPSVPSVPVLRGVALAAPRSPAVARLVRPPQVVSARRMSARHAEPSPPRAGAMPTTRAPVPSRPARTLATRGALLASVRRAPTVVHRVACTVPRRTRGDDTWVAWIAPALTAFSGTTVRAGAAMLASIAPATAPVARAGLASAPRRSIAPVEPPAGGATLAHGTEPQSFNPRGALSIDGVQIGRWMTDYLTDQAARPPSGISGIDDHLTPIFAGMVGPA